MLVISAGEVRHPKEFRGGLMAGHARIPAMHRTRCFVRMHRSSISGSVEKGTQLMRSCRLAAPCLALILLACSVAAAAEEPTWQPVTTELLKSAKPGYGGLCGVLVDPQTGCVYLNLSDKGVYCSSDQCKSFKKQHAAAIKGRTEWPGCFQMDPTRKSKTIVMALVYGAPIGVSRDEGATWKMMDGKTAHVDWFAVDWTDPDLRFVMTMKHESGDLVLLSRDGGKTFTELGKGYSSGWIFDSKTAVVVQSRTKEQTSPVMLRTTDGGEKWLACRNGTTRALPKWHDGKLYWLFDGSLVSTADMGKTWDRICDLKDGRVGPIFGKDSKHMFVLTGAGIIETADGGSSWSKAIPMPKEMKGVSPLTWIDYDSRNDILYTMKMTSELYQLRRRK
jgi:hypothetical protein